MNTIMANPMISASITAMMMNMIAARMVMASAFSHPQSKKCCTSRSQAASIAMMAIQPLR